MNSLIGSIFIGFLQGVLEWLPVSSEGNLVIILVGLFGFEVDSTISTVIFLHIGTGFSALVYFRLEVIDILVGRTDETRSLRLKLFVITLITGLVGFPIYLWLDVSTVYSELLLVVTGLALITTGLLQREAGKREEGVVDLSWPLSTLLGVAQGLAIMPGLSRSGLTTSIMLLNKYTSENAFRLSFLMSIPASFAAAFGLMLLKDFSLDPFTAFSSLVAAIIGYITIGGLLKVARAVSFWKICVALGVLTIIIWLPVLTV